MNNKTSPIQAGVVIGLPVGLVLGLLVLVSDSSGAGMGRVGDALMAVVIGTLLVGIVAALVQWRRIMTDPRNDAAPGWYDSPEEDGTQWYWSGTEWTERTREKPGPSMRPNPNRF